MVILPKYTFGVGDRYAREGAAQLKAFAMLADKGIDVSPVWNKSHREHYAIGTTPSQTRREADDAVAKIGWKKPYFVDADHITSDTVGEFIPDHDYFTMDVADFIGKPDPDAKAFADRMAGPSGTLRVELPGGLQALEATRKEIEAIADKFLSAIREAGRIQRSLESARGAGTFVTEVSMDETDVPQTPMELYLICAMIAEEKIPAQTIAPKFPGRFNKGVEYVGDIDVFAGSFARSATAVALAAGEFDLPKNLKLSVHSGSDKFSIYPLMRKTCDRFGLGFHIKTGGTTWVEEIAAVAAAGADGLAAAKEVYAAAYAHIDELVAPYVAVIDIDRARLPTPEEMAGWSGDKFAATVRHEQDCPDYNVNARQLLHIGYKFAAKQLGQRYYDLLDEHAEFVGAAVTDNIYRRHLSRLFFD